MNIERPYENPLVPPMKDRLAEITRLRWKGYTPLATVVSFAEEGGGKHVWSKGLLKLPGGRRLAIEHEGPPIEQQPTEMDDLFRRGTYPLTEIMEGIYTRTGRLLWAKKLCKLPRGAVLVIEREGPSLESYPDEPLF